MQDGMGKLVCNFQELEKFGSVNKALENFDFGNT
jgi:hypothetical protein